MKFSRAAVGALLLFFMAVTLAMPGSASAAHHHKRVRHGAVMSGPTGVNDPRYADLVMDPTTGEILHQQNPDGRRHPASLTKMMTLYLLFDALQKGKIGMDDRMPVSQHAAAQPQTNIALDPGEYVPVETAIKAIVVRSANDVAVVISEALGGSEDRFADMMNAKARALGMTHTRFENANGLPNDSQYTTARDMAKLGIALKRDFPQYYPYFSTREFSWQGVSYYTHNRVMLRYAGVDGIKTGFIGNSGFNLVTSVTRGGRRLIGVVMGGTTGAWRDNRMIELLNQSYTVLASRGNTKGTAVAANLPDTSLPAPVAGADDGTDEAGAEDGSGNAPAVAVAAPSAPTSAPAVASTSPAAHAPVAPTKPVVTQATVTAPTKPVVPQVAAVAPPVQTAQPAPSVKTLPSGKPLLAGAVDAGWGIQVGAFSTPLLAKQATDHAVQLSPVLKGSHIALDEGTRVHRARLDNLSENQARKACEALISNNSPCFIYKAGTQNL